MLIICFWGTLSESKNCQVNEDLLKYTQIIYLIDVCQGQADEDIITLSPISSFTTMHIDEGLHGQLDVKAITLFMSN